MDKDLILHILPLIPIIAFVIGIGAAFIALIIGGIIFVFFHKQPNTRLLIAVTVLSSIITLTPIACYYLYQYLITP